MDELNSGKNNLDENYNLDNTHISRSQVKKDYLKKDFANPYFIKNKKTTGFNTALYLKIFFILLAIYILVYSSLFKIQKVAVNGAEMIKPEEITATIEAKLNSKRWFILPRRNIFFLSKGELTKLLNSKYSLSEIKIKKGWRVLTINIKEKISNLIIYNIGTQKFYLVNLEGIVNEEVPKEGIAAYWEKFPILNVNEGEIKIGDAITTTRMAGYILELDKNLKSQQFNVQGYEKMGVNEAAVVMKEGWRAYFDVNADIKTSVDSLLLVYSKIDRTKRIQYIDLRFGNKVFYQ